MPSSVIDSFGYDETDHRLIVRFVNGRVYAYRDVPAEIASGFAAAESKGRYFNRVVRDRFAFVRARSYKQGAGRHLRPADNEDR